jgi:hypothetical protein
VHPHKRQQSEDAVNNASPHHFFLSSDGWWWINEYIFRTSTLLRRLACLKFHASTWSALFAGTYNGWNFARSLQHLSALLAHGLHSTFLVVCLPFCSKVERLTLDWLYFMPNLWM